MTLNKDNRNEHDYLNNIRIYSQEVASTKLIKDLIERNDLCL